MELKFPANPVEMSETFKSKNFGFGDGRVLMTILRSKMYSDPIGAICQEILSNSRDANREVGKGHLPVRVKLPNRFDETISFIDEGPGITPDRIENVFILYGNSTKRGDNVQTGGFGLGAKTPFAYTDTFTITTITDDVDGRHKRQYIAVIDETQLGLLSLISTIKTDEPTGTSISMAVKTNDIEKFVAAITKVGNYWKFRPIVEGAGNFNWTNIDYLYKGSDWSVERGSGEPLIIIDGISYRINKDLISGQTGYGSGYYNQQTNNEYVFLNYPLRLIFATGELAVTANREDLDYQPDIIDKIRKRIKKAFDELKDRASKEIANAPNLWDASILWNNGFSEYKKFIKSPSWNGHDLQSTVTIPYNYTDQIKILVFEHDEANYSVTQVKQWRRYVREVSIRSDMLLVENDMADGKRPDRLRLLTLFEANPKISQIGVVEFTTKAARAHYESHFKWSHLNPTMFAAVARKVLPPAARVVTKRNPISRVKELRKKTTGRGGYEWKPCSLQLDDKDGGVYVIIKDGKPWVNGKHIENYLIWQLKKVLDIDIYGILWKFRNKVGPTWETLTTYSTTEVLDLSKDPDVINYLKYGTNFGLASKTPNYYNELVKIRSDIEKPDGIFMEYWEASDKGRVGEGKARRLTQLQDALGLTVSHSANSLKATQVAFSKAYPLVKMLEESYYYSQVAKEKVAKEIVFYINAKDRV